VDGFSAEVLRRFKDYAWPGNIRQLSNVIERALLMEEGTIIQPESVMLPQIRQAVEEPKPTPAVLKLTAAQEKEMILQALDENLWIQKDAARSLDISPRALNYRVKKLGISHHRWRRNK
jgi:DNA-binding NtrC family response regulator